MIKLADDWGGVDVVFNNAGIMHGLVCIINPAQFSTQD